MLWEVSPRSVKWVDWWGSGFGQITLGAVAPVGKGAALEATSTFRHKVRAFSGLGRVGELGNPTGELRGGQNLQNKRGIRHGE